MAPTHGVKFMFCCFKGSKVSDFDESDQAIVTAQAAPLWRSKSWFSKFSVKKKKKTDSPVETSNKLIKQDKKDRTSRKQKQQPSTTIITTVGTPKFTASPLALQRNAMTVMCNSRTILAPLLFVSNKERTGTAKVHSGMSPSLLSPRSTSKKSKRQIVVSLTTPDSGLSILLLSLIATVIFGRAFAVLLVCLWLYLIRLPISLPIPAGFGRNNKILNVNSEEHKKKIVLDGLLYKRNNKPLSNGANAPNRER